MLGMTTLPWRKSKDFSTTICRHSECRRLRHHCSKSSSEDAAHLTARSCSSVSSSCWELEGLYCSSIRQHWNTQYLNWGDDRCRLAFQRAMWAASEEIGLPKASCPLYHEFCIDGSHGQRLVRNRRLSCNGEPLKLQKEKPCLCWALQTMLRIRTAVISLSLSILWEECFLRVLSALIRLLLLRLWFSMTTAIAWHVLVQNSAGSQCRGGGGVLWES